MGSFYEIFIFFGLGLIWGEVCAFPLGHIVCSVRQKYWEDGLDSGKEVW